MTDTPDLLRRDLDVLWHPCAQMRDYRLPPPDGFPPLHVVAAHGCRIHLADGSALLDAISSWWCKSLGHGHPRLRAALVEQAHRFEHVILANTTNEGIVRLSERLVDLFDFRLSTFDSARKHASRSGDPVNRQSPIANPHFPRVFYASDGSTAVEIALKMAIQAQAQKPGASADRPRNLIAHLENGYHGETLATLAVGDCGLYGDPFRSLFFPTLTLTGLPYRTGPEDPCWLDAQAQWPAIQNQLDAHADRLAAILYEPVLQAAGGMRLVSPDLLNHLRSWADAHGVYLIADEVAAGMGRCGAMLASHLAAPPAAASPPNGHAASGHDRDDRQPPSGISAGRPYPAPDILVLSKGLTGGVLPLSAVIADEHIYNLFDADYHEHRAFMHSNTYFGNALAVAVANATLDVYRDEHILQYVAQHGPTLRQGLAERARTRPCLANVRGVGMMAAVDLRRPDGSALDPRRRTGYAVYRQAVRRGALLRNLGDTLYLFPPLNTPPDDLQAMLDILGHSVDAVLR